MEPSIITTKFFAPRPAPRQVARPRLLERLSAWQDKPLTLVSAPPGFGKSTLVGEWLGFQAARYAWLSLDPEDDDPIRFWTFLVQALKGVLQTELVAVERLLQSPSPSGKAVVAELINRLSECRDPVILVLDDYHTISSPSIHEAFLQLIERLPGPLHVVLVTRKDPPFPLARWRARGLLNELRAADLRFEPEETAAYLNDHMSLGLSGGDLAALARSTEGWVTGLQLAALSLQQATDRSAFVAAFAGSNRYILDFLVEEVLRLQPEEVQRFLLESSILERLSGPLCDELLDTTDGQDMLEHVERANLFLLPLDEERQWYRYHHLFADMLRHQLARRQPGKREALHLKASVWFERHGQVSDAMHHALAGKHFERAADLFAGVEPLLRRGETTTVLGWLSALPEELLDRRADLLILKAWALFPTGRHELLDRLSQQAERVLAGSPDPDGATRAQLLALRAFTARTKGDTPGAITSSEQALAALPAHDWMWRSQVALNLATSRQQLDQTDQALESFEAVLGACREVDDGYHLTLGLALKGMYLMELGRLSAACVLFEEALDVAEAHGGRSTAVASFAWVGLGMLYYQQDRVSEAMQHLQEGLACAEGAIEPSVNGCRVLATLYARQGEQEAAERTWQQGLAIVKERRLVFFERYLKAHRAVMGPEGTAGLEEWIGLCQAMGDLRAPHSPLEDKHLLLAQAHLRLGHLPAGLAVLEQVVALALSAGRIPLAIQAMVCQVCHQPEQPQSLELLKHALDLAAPIGFTRPFVGAATRLAPLLRQLDGQLPAALRPLVHPAGGSARQPLLEGMAEALSDREHEVMRVIAEGLTNQEIAQRLVIEVSTVKRHVTNLFGKLGVTNRTQAVARARALGLI